MDVGASGGSAGQAMTGGAADDCAGQSNPSTVGSDAGAAGAGALGVCGRSFVLPVELAAGVFDQCSRDAPVADEGFWLPQNGDILRLQRGLPQFLAEQVFVVERDAYCYQYAGFFAECRRKIYVNAVRAGIITQPGEPWLGCDGAWNFWGAVFDVESGTFSDFAINGFI